MKINSVIISAVLICMAFASYADTGVWTNVSGGYWADTNNWQNGYVPLGAPNFADFSMLSSGETVIITNYTGTGAVLFTGAVDSAWTLTSESNATIGFASTPLSPGESAGEIRVIDGTLNLNLPIGYGSAGILKTGSGGLRISTTNDYSGDTRIDEGSLILAEGAALQGSRVILNATNAVLALEGDASIGGILSGVFPEPDVELNGHNLRIGGSQKNAEWGGRLTGDGSLTMIRGEVQTLTSTQSFAGVTCLENGSLTLGKDVGRTVALWRFDNSSDIGQDSGTLGNDLVPTGTPTQWYVDDPQRGGVLSLDNGAYLAGQGSNKDVTGLPADNSPFTITFWMKPASDVPSTAVVYGWGSYSHYSCNGMRLDTPSDSTPLMHTDWDNNHSIPFSDGLMDGNWHHVAIVYTGSKFWFYIDGILCLTSTQSTELSVVAGNFTIGRGNGWSSNYYKGLIDDFMIADWAMNDAELYAVRSAGLPDTSLYTLNNVLPSTTHLEIGYEGFLHLLGDQTLATLGGEGAAGGVTLQNGGTLTVAGIGNETSTVFRSAVSGDGQFVKRGADYTLTMTGGNSYTGATEVQEGTLAITSLRSVSGLQACYLFNDPDNLGKDSSGNGYDLIAENTPVYTSDGKYGGAVSFATADHDMLVAESFPETLPTNNSSYTYAFWSNPSTGNTKGMPIYWGGASVGSLNASLLRFEGTTSVLLSNFGNNRTVSAGFDLFDDALSNGWHHIAGTFDSSTGLRKLYIDGVLTWTDSSSYTLNISDALFQLGGAPYSTANYYDGKLDNLMIFNRSLSDYEVQKTMAASPVRMDDSEVSSHLVACYHFEDESDLGKDSGPYGYDLSVAGSAGVVSTGKRGMALSLSNSTQGYLAWTNSVFPAMIPTNNNPITISAWINPLTDADSSGAVVFSGLAQNKKCHLLGLRNVNDSLGVYFSDAQTPNLEVAPVERLDLGYASEGWHHVAAVYTGSGRTLYFDGIQVAEDDRSWLSVPSSGAFYIGYKPTASSSWFQGQIDEVEIFDTALSYNQLLSVMRGGADILPSMTDLRVSSGAAVELNGESQQVSALNGDGSVVLGSDFSYAGALTVSGTGGIFAGSISGFGDLIIRDGAVQTLSGAGGFVGAITVSNAVLLVENVSGSICGAGDVVSVLDGGRLGGAGSIEGDVIVSDGGGFIADGSSTGLNISGNVTLSGSGVVTLPEGFTTGKVTLFTASSVTAPSGVDGWTVEGVDNSLEQNLKVEENSLILSVYFAGTMVIIQ